MKGHNPSQQSADRSKNVEEPLVERRRQALRRKARRVAGRGVRLAENVALKGAAMSLRVARKIVHRIGDADEGTPRKRINVGD